MRNLRSIIRAILRSRLPLVCLLLGLVWMIGGWFLPSVPSRMIIATDAFTLCAAIGFGYSLRMRKEFPRLKELRRSEYKKVWNELTPNFESAAVAATGESRLEDIYAAGEVVASRIAEKVSLSRNAEVLEIGCGVGRVGRAMAPRCASWTGCDVSKNMLRHAAKTLELFHNVQLMEVSGEGLPAVEDNSLDVVYSTNMLPHLTEMDRWVYVREAVRVLRPGGWLYTDTIDLDSPEGWLLIDNNLLQRSDGVDAPYAPTPSTAEEVLAYFKRAGFTRTQVEHRGSLLIVTGKKP